MTLDEFLSRLDGVRPYKAGHMALCPGHDDQKGSLSVRVQGTIIRPHCFAKCTKDHVLETMQLTWRDLYTDGHAPASPGKGGKRHVEWVLDAEYDYTNEDGEVEFQVVRKRPADGAMDKMIFQRRPVPHHPGQWALGLNRGWYTPGRDDQWRRDEAHKGGPDAPPGDARAVYLDEQRPLLYRLGDFIAGRHWIAWPGVSGVKGRWVVVCEGEGKVEALLDLAIPATTAAQGAGKWKPEHAKQLVLLGVKRVVLSPDNDPPGSRHMVDVARSCWANKLEVRWLLP